MFMQCIRELVMIEEEKEKADNGEDEDDEDDEDGMIDDGDDDDDDDDDDDADDDDDDMKADSEKANPGIGLVAVQRSAKGSSATYKRLAALAVPEGGYDEEEDCLNTEDEEYRQVRARENAHFSLSNFLSISSLTIYYQFDHTVIAHHRLHPSSPCLLLCFIVCSGA